MNNKALFTTNKTLNLRELMLNQKLIGRPKVRKVNRQTQTEIIRPMENH